MAAKNFESHQEEGNEVQYIEYVTEDYLQNAEQVEYFDISNSSQDHNNEHNTTNTVILKELTEIKKQLHRSEESNKKMITKLTEEIISLRTEITRLKARDEIETDTSLLPNLPFYELASLKEFDDKLLLDDNIRTQLKHVVRKIGGEEIPIFVRSAMKQIVSDELAINLTWRGTPDKPSIQNFTIFSIIRDMCHSKFPHSTDVQINKIIQQHFLHARDRVLKRKRSNVELRQ